MWQEIGTVKNNAAMYTFGVIFKFLSVLRSASRGSFAFCNVRFFCIILKRISIFLEKSTILKEINAWWDGILLVLSTDSCRKIFEAVVWLSDLASM